MASFRRLVRFAQDDTAYYGELLAFDGAMFEVRKLHGDPFVSLSSTDEIVKTRSLLCPIERAPLVICVGLNYRAHAAETHASIPKYPEIFYKPADALAGPFDDVIIHSAAQESLDYEGELAFVFAKDAKDVEESHALSYVLGYSVGNDITARNFQPMTMGGQFCYAKSFDGFAPLGHAIVSTELFGEDPIAARLTTRVNGIVKQSTLTDDMIFRVPEIIAHVTRGTTIRKGTVVMTGTPSGVGFFEGQHLADGDVVEVEIENVGRICNKTVFKK